MSSTRQERQRLLKELLERGEERPDLDYKQDLHLDNRGDKAEFVKDVLALANSSETGYIVTGVEDKTWKPIGISQHHAQTELNSVLKGKTDPRIQVQYVELEVDDVEHGIVTISADNPPYLVAVADRYGGQVSTSRRKEAHITRGTVYVRIQDQNDGASRGHLDVIYSAKQDRDPGVQASADLFLQREALATDSYHLRGQDSFVLLLVYPVRVAQPLLDRRTLSDQTLRREFHDIVLSVRYEPPNGAPPGPVSALRDSRAGEDTMQLLAREREGTPLKLLKMDVHGRISWGYVWSSDRIEYFQMRAACDWLFRVAARLYERYDPHRSLGRLGIQLRLRAFADKPLAVQLTLPGAFNTYEYEGSTDPRAFPREPMEAPVGDLGVRHRELADELMDYVKRSYRQVG
jgi:hypothetical protein